MPGTWVKLISGSNYIEQASGRDEAESRMETKKVGEKLCEKKDGRVTAYLSELIGRLHTNPVGGQEDLLFVTFILCLFHRGCGYPLPHVVQRLSNVQMIAVTSLNYR